jgi:hypothetical protein
VASPRDALVALFHAQAGGFLTTPPGWDGKPTLGIAGISGAPRARGEWDALDAADAPGLPGAELRFVALADGTLVVDADVPDGALGPLADAVERRIRPPYLADAVRRDGDVWAVSARVVGVVELPEELEGERIELTRVDGVHSFAVDGEPVADVPAEVDVLDDKLDGDYALVVERFDATLWTAVAYAL